MSISIVTSKSPVSSARKQKYRMNRMGKSKKQLLEIESPYPMNLNIKTGVTKKTDLIDRSEEL